MVTEKNKTHAFKTSDILLLLFAGVVFATYRYEKDLSPESLLFFTQITLLWFILRITHGFYSKSKAIMLIGLPAWGVIEAAWGVGQLYGCFPTKHALFKTTGSFLNPGPYGGFISLMLPLVLHYWLSFKDKNKSAGYLSLFAGTVCLIVFPATLSRTAWISAIAGCAIVLLSNRRIIEKCRSFWKCRKRHCVLGATILSMFLLVAAYGVYHLKKDSADGRIFMWRITSAAIRESALKGTGMGGFPSSYAKAQMEYFKDGRGSKTERAVAGSPEYAFNEYLRIFLEQGVFGFILFLSLSFLIIKSGIRNKQAGAAGSFAALSVFAFGSYPYQLWQFPVVWLVLGVVCTTEADEKNTASLRCNRKATTLYILLLAVLCFVSIACLSRQKTFYRAKREWKKLQHSYTAKAYESTANDYKKLYPILNHNPEFVFEYGIILNNNKQREKADSIFNRGLEISSDPMFLNVKGRNCHEMGKYNKAEECYIRSALLLPGRIYPHYLLTKLYADPANYQPKKMRRAAAVVLEKEPKVHSKAIEEMRAEVKKILKEKGVAYE